MYTIQPDTLKNRLYLTFSGTFTLEEAKQCIAEVIIASGKLKKGYVVINDLSQLKVFSQEITKEIEKMQLHFVSSGARLGIRIIGGSAIIGMQFKRTAKNAGYTSVNVSSILEAEKLLNTTT